MGKMNLTSVWTWYACHFLSWCLFFNNRSFCSSSVFCLRTRDFRSAISCSLRGVKLLYASFRSKSFCMDFWFSLRCSRTYSWRSWSNFLRFATLSRNKRSSFFFFQYFSSLRIRSSMRNRYSSLVLHAWSNLSSLTAKLSPLGSELFRKLPALSWR